MWSTWKIHKYLAFKPGSSQNGIFSNKREDGAALWKQQTPVQNGRVETYGESSVSVKENPDRKEKKCSRNTGQ